MVKYLEKIPSKQCFFAVINAKTHFKLTLNVFFYKCLNRKFKVFQTFLKFLSIDRENYAEKENSNLFHFNNFFINECKSFDYEKFRSFQRNSFFKLSEVITKIIGESRTSVRIINEISNQTSSAHKLKNSFKKFFNFYLLISFYQTRNTILIIIIFSIFKIIKFFF